MRRRTFEPVEVARAGAALAALIAVDVVLRLVGYRRTARLVTAVIPPQPRLRITDPRDDPRALALVTAVDRAAYVFRPGAMCLRRSLVLQAWLRRRGYATRIRLGVRSADDGAPVGHAWLTWRGVPVFEQPGGGHGLLESPRPARHRSEP